MSEIYTVESTQQKKEQKKEQKKQEYELFEKESLDFLNNEFLFFYYEKLDNRPPTRDFRLELQKMFCYMYYKKKIVDIPEITKLKIKFGSEYNMIFENRQDFVETEIELRKKMEKYSDKKLEPIIFEKSRFKYVKNIEGQQYGIVDN